MKIILIWEGLRDPNKKDQGKKTGEDSKVESKELCLAIL